MQFVITGFRRLESVSVTLDAANAVEARRMAAAQGLTVVGVRSRFNGLPTAVWSKGPAFPLVQFSQSLHTLLEAGLSVVEGIDTLSEREVRADVRRVLSTLLGQLREGLGLSLALERQPDVFPVLYVAMVRANERSGGLAEALGRYVAYRLQADQIRKRVISASIYPLMILGVGALVVGFMLVYVVPRFSMVFQDLGERMPYGSQVLLTWGRFAHDHAALLVAASLGALAAAAFTVSRPAVRSAIVQALQRIPRIGRHLRVYELARFYRALGMLQLAGIPIVTALDMVVGLLPPTLHPALAHARKEVSQGRALSMALDAHGLTTAVSLRLLRVAERTGRMGELLQRSADFHDDEVAQAIDWFMRLVEPLLMLAIGIVIGIVVLLMYAPIFELAGGLQ